MEQARSPRTTVPNFEVDSGSVGSAAAFNAFAGSVADVFAIAPIPGASIDTYALDLSAWHLGTLMIGSFSSSALAFERSHTLIATSGVDHLLVQLYIEGGFVGTADDRPVLVRPGDIVTFDLARTLSTVATPFRNISVLVPRSCFADALDDVGRLHGAVQPRETQMAGLLTDYLVSLVERLPRVTPEEAIVSANATVALAVTVLAGQAPARDEPTATVASPFRTVASYIDANLHDPQLNADTIATDVAMSRASLYRLFERVGGVAGYIRRRRLIGAALALAAPVNRHRRIGEIAYERGFTSEVTFSRAFRQVFGVSPSMARARAAMLLTAGPIGSGAPVDHAVFAGWIRSLQR